MKSLLAFFICSSSSLFAMEKSIQSLPIDELHTLLKESLEALDNKKITEICRHCKQNKLKLIYQNNETPLHLACKTDLHPTIVQIMITAFGDIETQDDKLFTPLHIACFHNNYEIAYLLVINGANPNIQNNKGWTPLHFSCVNGDIKTTKMLIRYQADSSIQDYLGKTPRDFAARHQQRDPDLMPLLLENKTVQKQILD